MVSARVFAALTDYLWKLTYKWACWSHPNKPKRWITGRYFGKFSKFRNDRWVFGDRDTGAYLPKPAWTDIVRHTLVKSGASPDDPAQYYCSGLLHGSNIEGALASRNFVSLQLSCSSSAVLTRENVRMVTNRDCSTRPDTGRNAARR